MRQPVIGLAFAAAVFLILGQGAQAAGTKSSGGATHASNSTKSKLPPGTKFVRKECKTAACKAKHPSGSYMLPIKPKKHS